jgi:hypothetical protein
MTELQRLHVERQQQLHGLQIKLVYGYRTTVGPYE